MTFTDRDFLIRRLPDFCLLIFILSVTLGAFNGGSWASIGIGGALIMLLGVWRIEKHFPTPDKRVLFFALIVLTVAACLSLQSTQPRLSWIMWGQLATIFLPLSLLTNTEIQKRAMGPQLFEILPWAAFLGVFLLGIELVLQGPLLKSLHGPAAGLYQYNRGLSYVVVLAFPILAMLWFSKRRLLAIIFILTLLLPASYTESRAAKLALVLALMATMAAYFLPLLMCRLLMLLPVVVCGWPFAIQKLFIAHHDWIVRLPPSWQDRTEIWDYTSYRIFERPWLGWGLGSSRMLPFYEPHGALYNYSHVAAPHPHNAVLQLWVELGLPGLIFGIVFSIYLLHRITRLRRELIPFAVGAWVSAFCLSMISYNFWSDSLWAAFALTAFLFALLHRALTASPKFHLLKHS